MATRAFHGGVAWSIAEVDAAWVYGSIQGGTPYPTLSGNVATFSYGHYLASVIGGVGTALPFNLFACSSIKTDDWGDAVGTSEYAMFGKGTGIKYKKNSATGWVVAVTVNSGSIVGTGTTEIPWANSATLSVIRELARIRVFINGTKEIDVSGVDSTGATGTGIVYIANGGVHAGKFQYIGKIISASSDTEEYIDASNFAFQTIIGGSGTPTYTGYPTVFPAATNKWDDIDDWSGTSDGDSTYNQSNTTDASTFRQSYATADFTMSNMMGLVLYKRSRVTVASKSPTIFLFVADASNKIESTTTGLSTTAYSNTQYTFATAPDGTAWAGYTKANLELGTGINIVGGANSEVITALQGEVYGCDFIVNATAKQKGAQPNQAVNRAGSY